MLLSIVIPAHNEAEGIEATVRGLNAALGQAAIPHEILVVNDNSRDDTEAILQGLLPLIPELKYLNNPPPHGFGFAVRSGLEAYSGDAVAICMADASDLPEDVVRFYTALREREVDCVFGSRFARGGFVRNYPPVKLALNRVVNTVIQLLFGIRYNDVTNAFKMYRRQVIDGVQPLLSHHFNLTVELPLKAIVRGFRYAVLPNGWIGRQHGVSKLVIREMGSRYLFIILYCLIERSLSRGDYHRSSAGMISLQRRQPSPAGPGVVLPGGPDQPPEDLA